jgi:drug/metabolite transporter (DMT)-like permease
MSFPILFLLAAVGSGLAYSFVDVIRKVLLDEIRAVPLLFRLSAGPVPVFVLWWLVAGGQGFGAGYLAPALGSVALNIVSNLLFLESVRLSPLSLTIPFLSLTPVFTALLAIPMLGEVPTALQFTGIGITVVGAFLLNMGGAGLSPRAAWTAFTREKGSVLMAIVALVWSFATPLDKLAMASASPAFHGLVLNVGVALGMLAMLLAQGRLREVAIPVGTRGRTFWAVILSFLGLALLLLSITRVWVSIADTIKRAINSGLALGLGKVVFGEAITPHKVVAVVLMTIGVVLILL